MTISGYFYATIPMVLGVVAMAAGLKQAIGRASEALPGGTGIVLAGGAALFLIGAASLRRAFGIGPIGLRLGGAALALAAIPLGAHVTAIAELLALVAIFVAVLAAERVREARLRQLSAS
jgi:low temperature requirement protein LtrA